MADTVSDHVVEILQDWGVDTVFGLPGDGINGLVEGFRKVSGVCGMYIAGTKSRSLLQPALMPSSLGA